ncbi:hypothetical protein, partial [Mycolicibacterium sp. CBMA 295]|uniref:hypothetical protein n=1 Tax=Mycolicibacterium sp. CBMA 295 TaxID=2606605 RepID=UPI00130A89EF
TAASNGSHHHYWTPAKWIPPPLLDTGQDRINHYWHPEELFHPPEVERDPDRGAEPVVSQRYSR